MRYEQTTQIKAMLDKARRALAESKCLHDGGFPEGTVSRAYTACYHSAVAVLLSRDIDVMKPSAMIPFFDRELVRRGHIEKSYHQLFIDAYRHRQIADVDNEGTITESQAVESMESAGRFIGRMERFLSDTGW